MSASYYATERFATTAFDMQGRLRHWRQALAMQPSDWGDRLFGMGSGSFPTTYYWHNPQREVPASIAYAEDGENRYVRLASPGYSAGHGELLRLLPGCPCSPPRATRWRSTAAHGTHARAAGAPVPAAIAVRPGLRERSAAPAACAAWHAPAVGNTMKCRSTAPGWAPAAWLLRPPVQLELAASGTATSSVLEVDNLSLRAPGGEELIANGSFTQANNYWFFSSDHHHLPWHIKSMALHLLIETGWCGALSMLALLVLAGRRLLRQAARGDAGALTCAAALLGFLVVGLFDSLLDVPRIALLCYLILLCALLQPVPPPHVESAPP